MKLPLNDNGEVDWYFPAKILWAIIDYMGGMATEEEIKTICSREVPFEDELHILRIAENLRIKYETADGSTT